MRTTTKTRTAEATRAATIAWLKSALDALYVHCALALLVPAAMLAAPVALSAQNGEDENWWVAEEVLSGQVEYAESPRAQVLPTDAYRDRGRGRFDKRDRDRYEDDDRDYYDRDRDRYDDRGRVRGRQPAIVYPGGRVRIRARARTRGRFAFDHYRPQWTRVDWNVRLRRRSHYRNHKLRDIVGRRTEQRLKDHRNWIGARGRLTYRWVALGRRGAILQVRAGRQPIAEFVDRWGDGYVDVVRLVR